jgi:spermidine synthase
MAAWGSPTPGLGFGLANRLLAIYTVARLRKEVLP